ncbi:MAG: PAS domain S-box protein, partial [Chloroflexota bacterium]
MTHRLLAVLGLVAAATQVLSALVGESMSGPAAIVLTIMVVPFLVADRLAHRDRPVAAILVSSGTILVAIPVLAWVFDGGYGTVLLAPIAFLIAVPYLRGRQLVGFGAIAVLATGFASAAPLVPYLRVTPVSEAVIADVASAFVGPAIVAALMFAMAFRQDRERTAAADRVERLLADSPSGLCRFSAEGRILEANPAFARIYGYPDAASLIGTPAGELLMDREEMLRLLERLRLGELVTSEVRGRRADGSLVWVRYSSRASLAADGTPRWFDSASEDITREREARDERLRLATIIDAAALAIIAEGLDDTILGVNATASRLWGWSEDVVGRSVFEVTAPGDREAIRAGNERVRAGEVVGPVEVHRVVDGRDLVIAVTRVPVRGADGAVIGVAVIGTDATERAAERRERDRLEEELEERRRTELVDRLAGGVAHDFNNLLTAIRGYASILTAELPSGTPAREAAVEILGSSGRAAEITHQLLAYARRQHLRVEVVDVDDLVADRESMLRRMLGPGISLDVQRSLIPALVSADRGELGEAVVPLVLAARESVASPGRVQISTRVTPVSREPQDPAGRGPAPDPGNAAGPANEVVLVVADTGRPIDPADQPHLFEPFYFGDAAAGRGMGLAAAHGIIRQSGGRIDVASGPDGTTFTVRLPRTAASPAPPIVAITPEHATPAAVILVVDDDVVVRTITRRILV